MPRSVRTIRRGAVDAVTSVEVRIIDDETGEYQSIVIVPGSDEADQPADYWTPQRLNQIAAEVRANGKLDARLDEKLAERRARSPR